MRLTYRPLVTILATLAIGGLNVWVATNPPSSAAIINPAQMGQEPAAADGLIPIPLPTALEATHLETRPIFRISRRPWVSQPLSQPPQATPDFVAETPPAPELQVQDLVVSLYGVQIEPDGTRALISKPGDQKPQWLRTGEAFDGWTLTQVDENSAKFAAGEAIRSIELHVPLQNGSPP